MEFPAVQDVIAALNRNLKQYPDTDLFVLSEYTFGGTVPESVKRWCRANQKWLIAGGREDELHPTERTADRWMAGLLIGGQSYRNTAFVVDTRGLVTFGQAKAQPIQFFRDGLPAVKQELWDSPWGKIGIAICYDASYRRVMDRLVEMGAQAFIIPAMDVIDWGKAEHELNARQSRLRAAEYGIPILRVASSGISQYISTTGHKELTASFGGAGEALACELAPADPAPRRLPLDSGLAPLCSIATGAAGLLLLCTKSLSEKWLWANAPAKMGEG
jgi:predicted amidohydrolase